MPTLTPQVNAVAIVVLGAAAFVLSLLARRVLGQRSDVNTSPWSSTLSYVATAYGIVIGQVGDVSTARETRLVAAQTPTPTLMWALLLGGGALVTVLIFIVTLPSAPVTQAIQVCLTTLFTTVMIALVAALTNPFAPGAGRVTPELIEQTRATMEAAAPELAGRSCTFDVGMPL